MEEDEKKQKSKKEKAENAASFIANVVKYAKYLANPVIFWIAVAILIIFFIISLIGFFMSLPGNALAQINNFFDKLFGKEQSIYVVDESELIDLCEKIEEMGYSLEDYGFVEEISREGQKNYQENGEESFESSSGSAIAPTRGTISSVKSKYLEAYIIAEKKTYAFANPESSSSIDQLETQLIYQDYYATQAVGEVIEVVWGSSDNYFLDAIKELYNYNSEGYYIKKNTKYKEKASDTEEKTYGYYVTTITPDSLKGKVKEFVAETYKEDGDGKNMEYAAVGKEIKEKLPVNKRTRFESYVDTIIDEKKATIITTNSVGAGLIVLENSAGAPITRSPGLWPWETQTVYKAEIKPESRYFVIRTMEYPEWLAKLLGDYTDYVFDLNNWVTKYGRPVEFLVSLHLATQAPDFVYEVATSPSVDAKVYLSLFPTEVSTSVVEALDGGGGTEGGRDLPSVLADASKELIRRIKRSETYKKIYDWAKDFWSNNPNAEAAIRNSFPDPASIREDNINFLIRLNNGCDLVLRNSRNVPDDVVSAISTIKDMLKIEVFGIEITPEDIKELNSVIEEYTGSFKSATPYIKKVVNHWYRNQYFVKDKLTDADRANGLTQMYSDIIRYIINKQQEIADKEAGGETVPQAYKDELASLKAQMEAKKASGESTGEITFGSDAEVQQHINDIINAHTEDLRGGFSGSAYKIVKNPAPFYYTFDQVEEAMQGTNGKNLSDNDKVKEVLRHCLIKEIRGEDIIQIHNPLFEDHSTAIRQWLGEKYYIFGPTTSTKEDEKKSNETTTVILNNEKLAEGKKYIQGKTALETVKAMLERCEDRSTIAYLQRDLIELFSDYEFDLENVDVPEQKVLTNVMPDYKPYTQWPSVFEQRDEIKTQDGDGTLMIFKTTGSADLVAPANGKVSQKNITDAEGNSIPAIEIEIDGDTSETAILQNSTLRITAEQGSIECTANGRSVKQGEVIGRAHSGSVSDEKMADNMIILNLYLFSASKQLLKVENYMQVECRNITDAEKKTLYNVQEWEAEKYYYITYRDPNQLPAIRNEAFLDELRSMIERAEKGVDGHTYTQADLDAARRDLKAHEDALKEGVQSKTPSSITSKQRTAIMNVIFNKILSPFKDYENCRDVSSTVNASLEEFMSYKINLQNQKEISELEDSCGFALQRALSGHDVTKEATLYGATRYMAIYVHYDGADKKREKREEMDNVKVKYEATEGYALTEVNRYFYINQEEYKWYLRKLINQKMNEIIYVLNQKKYLEGMEEYDEEKVKNAYENLTKIKTAFEPIKEQIVNFYADSDAHEYTEGNYYIAADPVVISIIKSNISQETEDLENGKKKVTDKFTFTANSNYITKFTLTYETGAEGQIEGEITMTHENTPGI